MTTQGEPSEAGILPVRLRAIGFWIDDDRPNLPDPAAFIDASWEVGERAAVAGYLSAGRTSGAEGGCSPCRICGAMNGFEEFTDGVYLWPEGLAHYVHEHAVRLPAEVVRHVLRSVDPASAVGFVDKAWWTAAMS